VSIEDLRARVEHIHWYHTIDLGNGIRTPGVDDTLRKLATLRMPEDLTDKSVLDVGAWDGFFSFEAERRGAAKVLATDSFCWGGEGWGTKEGFDLAREVLGSKVRDIEIEVHELSPETVGVFDVVLFLGVLYHLENPFLALDRVSSVTGDHLILSTETDLLWTTAPAMAFYPANELNDDPTNWWGPNPAAIEAMLRAVGFRRVRIVYEYPRALRLARAMNWKAKSHAPFIRTLRQGRIVYHAWR
jgi:tRNA (mo5U34)-methyltransferase